jgi:hypothetical protein
MSSPTQAAQSQVSMATVQVLQTRAVRAAALPRPSSLRPSHPHRQLDVSAWALSSNNCRPLQRALQTN